MAVTVIRWTRASEVEWGISGDSDSRTVAWWAKLSAAVAAEDSDEGDKVVLDYAETHCPIAWDGLPRGPFSIEQKTPVDWLVTANYAKGDSQSSREDPATATAQWDFEVTLDSQRRYTAIAQQKFGTAAPDQEGFLNVVTDNGQARVEGVDVFYTRMIYRLRVSIPQATMTTAYINTVAGLAGKINGATYKGIPKGELMFLGWRGSVSSSGDSDMSFEFQRRKTPTLPLVVGVGTNAITIPTGTEIYGWDIVEAVWKTAVDVTVNDMKAGPKGVYVSRVFDFADFTALGI